MERVYYLGGVTAASILAVVPADNLMMWAWLLMAAEMVLCMLLRKQSSRSRTKPVPVRSKAHRPIRRTISRSPWC